MKYICAFFVALLLWFSPYGRVQAEGEEFIPISGAEEEKPPEDWGPDADAPEESENGRNDGRDTSDFLDGWQRQTGLEGLEDSFDFEGQLDAAGAREMTDALPDSTKELMREAGVEGVDWKQLLTLSPANFFKAVWKWLIKSLSAPIRVFASLMGIVLLCALLQSLKTALGESSLTTVFSVVSVVCVATAIVGPIVECINSTAAAIRDFSNFVIAFIPVFSSIVTVGGQPATATTYMAFLFLACQVVSQITASTFVPLMGIYLAMCIAGGVAPDLHIDLLAKGIKSAVSWGLGLLLTLFVALLSVQTAVSSGGDAALSKTAKFLIGSFVPVVGGALGDAFIATQGYMRLLKTTVGAFGILAAMMTFLPVLLQTIAWYLTANLTAALGELLGIREIPQILKSAGTALGVLIAVLLCFALLIIISTSLVLMVSSGT